MPFPAYVHKSCPNNKTQYFFINQRLYENNLFAERQEYSALKIENDQLKIENENLKTQLRK